MNKNHWLCGQKLMEDTKKVIQQKEMIKKMLKIGEKNKNSRNILFSLEDITKLLQFLNAECAENEDLFTPLLYWN